MTTVQTNEKPKNKKTETEESSETSKRKSSRASQSAGSDDRGYATTFEHWEPAPVEPGVVTLKPTSIITIFDTRAESPSQIESVIEATKNGIETPIRVTKMRYLGPDGATGLSPDPSVKIKLKKGEVYNVLVFGRCRTRAAIFHKFPEITATIKPYTDWLGMVKDAHQENSGRIEPNVWDLSWEIYNLHRAGKTHEDIAATLVPSVSPGKVSHYIAVFALPEPVQALYKSGALTPTHARHLRPLAADPDEVLRLANKAIAKGWTGDELHAHIKAMKEADKENKEGKEEKKKLRIRATDYSSIPLKATPVEAVRTILSNVEVLAKTQKAKAQQAEDDPEAYVKRIKRAEYLRGVQEGFRMAYGVDEIPGAFTAEDSEE